MMGGGGAHDVEVEVEVAAAAADPIEPRLSAHNQYYVKFT